MKIMTARYSSPCAGCGGEIKKGEKIVWTGREAFHNDCAPSGDPIADQQYWQGRAEGLRFSADRKMYGDALAERFAMDEELARFNRGEDD